jgi:hypothetical protein
LGITGASMGHHWAGSMVTKRRRIRNWEAVCPPGDRVGSLAGSLGRITGNEEGGAYLTGRQSAHWETGRDHWRYHWVGSLVKKRAAPT